jgi:hypothetical protein
MLPYSVGHETILLSQRNPIVLDGFEQLSFSEKRQAIIRAALVCYRTWEQNNRPERNLRLWLWKIRKSNWASEIAEFINYRVSGSLCPPSPSQAAYEIAAGVQNEETGRSFGSPHAACLIAFLCPIHSSLGYVTPWDVPLGLANFLYFSQLEMAGNVRIKNARESQAESELAEHESAIKKERQCPD